MFLFGRHAFVFFLPFFFRFVSGISGKGIGKRVKKQMSFHYFGKGCHFFSGFLGKCCFPLTQSTFMHGNRYVVVFLSRFLIPGYAWVVGYQLSFCLAVVVADVDLSCLWSCFFERLFWFTLAT